MTTDGRTPAAALDEAIAAAQAEFSAPRRTAENPHFRSRFAPLEEVVAAARPALNKHGIAVIQALVSEDGRIGVRTLLAGHGAERDCGTLAMPAPADPQKAGSLITYLRRYSLASALALAAEDDDDGNAAAAAAARRRAVKAEGEAIADADAKADAKAQDAPARAVPGPSAKQVKYIYALARDAGYTDGALDAMLMARFAAANPQALTRDEASRVIEGLKAAGPGEDEDAVELPEDEVPF